MKVLQVNASYKPAYIYGGPTMSVAMLCEQLVVAGVDVTVFTTTANGSEELSVPVNTPVDMDGVRVFYFKRITKDHTHFSPSLLKKLWKEVKSFDVVHIHAWWNLVSVLACFIAIKRKVPVVISSRGTLSPYSFSINNATIKKMIHRFLGKRLLEKSNFHVTSVHEQERVLQIITPKTIRIIPNLVRLPVQSKNRTDTGPEDHLKLIFLSRIEAKKGLDILFNALPLVTIPYSLTIAGTGNNEYVEQLKQLAITNGISDKITWIGFQTEQKFALLRSHDLMVLPSYDENFGNVVIESLAEGTAVLVNENVGLADHVNKNNLGWICQTNARSISDIINHIGGKRDGELARIREKAPSIIYRDLDPAKLSQQYLAFYDQIIKHARL